MLVQLLSKGADIAMLSFVISSMLALGASLTIAQIIEPLRNVRLVLLALLGNFVAMPALALVLANLLRLDGSLESACWCSGARQARRFCQSSQSVRRATLHLPSA